MPKAKSDFAVIAETFAISLIYEASGGIIGHLPAGAEARPENPVTFRDRRALLDSITKLLAAEEAPEEEAQESGLSVLRERLSGNRGTLGRAGSSESSEDD